MEVACEKSQCFNKALKQESKFHFTGTLMTI